MISSFARFSPRSLLGSRSLTVALLLGLTTFITACGGGGGGGSPPPPTLTSISLSPLTPSVSVSSTQQFAATGVYSDGSKQTITSSVTWTSSATTIATISSGGLATGVAAGTTTITAASGSVSGTTTLTVTGAALVSIDVTPALPHLVQGTTQQFTAMGVYSDNSMQNLTAKVTWASATTSVATISAAGLATAVAAGTSSITATLSGITGSTTMTVTAATLLSIAVTPANSDIGIGTTEQLTATGNYSNHTTQNITSSVTWSSSNPGVATVSATGKAAAVAIGGPVTVTATLGTVSGTTPLTVTNATLVSIAVTPAAPIVPKGTTQQFIATGTYSDKSTQVLTDDATWSSSAPAFATISNALGLEGLASALTVGTTTITASMGSIAGTTTLTVSPAALVSIAVTPAMPSVINQFTVQLTATGTYTDNSTQSLTTTATWTSATPAVATISNASPTQGLATGVAVGTSLITAAVGTIVSPAVTLKVTPSEYVYASNFSDGTVSQYTVGAGGALVPMTPAFVYAGTSPYAITVDPTHHYAYVVNSGSSNLSQYSIGPTGALTALTPATVSTGSGPNGVTLSSNGLYAYVANFTSGNVSQYTVNGDGTLSPMTPATVTASAGSAEVTLNAAGTYAYVPNFGSVTPPVVASTVSVFSIGVGGALTLASTAALATNSQANSLAIDPTGAYAYVSAQYLNTIQEFPINPDGSLATGSGTSVSVGGNPWEITGFGNYLYVSNRASNSIQQLTIGAGGALTLFNTTQQALGTGPNDIAFDASGEYAYVADRGPVGGPYGTTLSQYSIGAGGVLAPLSTPTVPAGNEPAWVVTSVGY
jgi:6-phosphogluconolactonase (cycloisomerase 2 family)